MSYAFALLSISAGMVHVSAAADHRNLPVMLAGFLVVATLQVGLGGLALLRRPGRLLLLAGIGLFAGSLGMWLLSRTSGLPFLEGGHMEPIGFKDGIAKVFEIGAIGAALLLMLRDLPSVHLPTARLGRQALTGLATGAFALSVPAMVLGGGEHHSAEQHAAMHEEGEEHGHGLLARGGDEHHGHDDASSAGGSHSAAHGKTSHAHEAGRHAGKLAAMGHADGHGLELADSGHGDHGAPAEGGKHPAGGHEHGGSAPDGAGEHGHGGGSGSGDAHGAGHDDNAEEPPDGLAWENGKPGEDGAPGRGGALVLRTEPSEGEGAGHAHGGPCSPTPEQSAAADRLARDTAAALSRYDNNPARALADGFYYAFGPTDRIMHMVSPARVDDPTILDPARIESFLYAMTDRGWMPIGGMYILPKHGMDGPQVGGCRTQWHYHGGVGGRIASAGTMEKTPPMLHVWTYPGLEPYGHYDGRELSQLWTPGKYVPSVCREAGDSSDVCLP